MSKSRVWLIFIVAALAAVVVTVTPSFAAKPGSGAPCSTPTFTGPTTASVGSTYTVNGCGFQPGQLVALSIGEANGCCLAFNTVADSSGAFTYTGNVWAPGKYSVTASVVSHNRWRVAAQWSFQATA